MATTPDAIMPTDVKLRLKSQELRIAWRDGHQTVFPLAVLRRHCPCAGCRDEREKAQRAVFPVLSINPDEKIEVTDAQLVGNYAVQLTWSDGHDAGIFDYAFLRSLEARVPPDEGDSGTKQRASELHPLD